MSVRLDIKGLEELKAALRELPKELTGEASHLVEAAGNGVVVDIRRLYPPGTLRDRVDVTFTASGVSTGARVRSRAPEAHLYEYGTEARHTRLGLNRGRMAPTHVFGQAMARVRARMYDDLRGLLERKGLRVTGRA